ncbi:MAG: response regulator transcription factor [Alphaproteobacteria bacterium]|nr:response regulator transcription factor [Alphaproteobacteria bacterium]MBV8406078.1 response regulator transcription factor [Alphaproteobacteria bacterium]
MIEAVRAGRTAASRYDLQPTSGVSQRTQVVFVEDDDLYRQAIETELTEEGFVVRSFKDGEPMLAAIGSGLVADVVLLDWGLERTLGIDLLAQLRERGLQWPIVFLTGRNSPVHERLALQRGASDFVDKLRGTSVLAARLRLAVASRRDLAAGASEEILHCGRVTLRMRTSRAHWDRVDVGLTVAEFRIVHLLVSNAGSFITYRQIYDCMHRVGFVAGSGEHGYRTNVRSAVRRIREKFKAQCTEFDEIQTYTSFGYCWRSPSTGA